MITGDYSGLITGDDFHFITGDKTKKTQVIRTRVEYQVINN